MHLSLLEKLNAARQQRQACMVVTDLATGRSGLVFPGIDHAYAAIEGQISDRFVSGASGEAVVDGARYFLRVYVPPVRLVIIGAVHIAQSLVTLADVLGYEAIVIDPRAIFASRQRFPAVRLITDWPGVALARLGMDRSTACVTLTHDPKLDDDALQYVLPLDCFYVGALGSRKTHARRVERLLEAGVPHHLTQRIAAPVGLPIGALTPEEIAVSIMAQVIATWRADRVARRAGP